MKSTLTSMASFRMESPRSRREEKETQSFSSDTLSQLSEDSLDYNPDLSTSVINQTMSDSVFFRSSDDNDDTDSLELDRPRTDASHLESRFRGQTWCQSPRMWAERVYHHNRLSPRPGEPSWGQGRTLLQQYPLLDGCLLSSESSQPVLSSLSSQPVLDCGDGVSAEIHSGSSDSSLRQDFQSSGACRTSSPRNVYELEGNHNGHPAHPQSGVRNLAGFSKTALDTASLFTSRPLVPDFDALSLVSGQGSEESVPFSGRDAIPSVFNCNPESIPAGNGVDWTNNVQESRESQSSGGQWVQTFADEPHLNADDRLKIRTGQPFTDCDFGSVSCDSSVTGGSQTCNECCVESIFDHIVREPGQLVERTDPDEVSNSAVETVQNQTSKRNEQDTGTFVWETARDADERLAQRDEMCSYRGAEERVWTEREPTCSSTGTKESGKDASLRFKERKRQAHLTDYKPETDSAEVSSGCDPGLVVSVNGSEKGVKEGVCAEELRQQQQLCVSDVDSLAGSRGRKWTPHEVRVFARARASVCIGGV